MEASRATSNININEQPIFEVITYFYLTNIYAYGLTARRNVMFDCVRIFHNFRISVAIEYSTHYTHTRCISVEQ